MSFAQFCVVVPNGVRVGDCANQKRPSLLLEFQSIWTSLNWSIYFSVLIVRNSDPVTTKQNSLFRLLADGVRLNVHSGPRIRHCITSTYVTHWPITHRSPRSPNTYQMNWKINASNANPASSIMFSFLYVTPSIARPLFACMPNDLRAHDW